jgi:hypothetical protein
MRNCAKAIARESCCSSSEIAGAIEEHDAKIVTYCRLSGVIVVWWKSSLKFEGTEFGAGSLAGNLFSLPAALPLPRVPSPLPPGLARDMEHTHTTSVFHLGWMVDGRNPLQHIGGVYLLPHPHTQSNRP